MENMTLEQIISDITSGVNDIMQDPVLIRGFNMGNGAWLYMWLESLSEDEKSPYMIPGQAVSVSLRSAQNGVSQKNLSLYEDSVPFFIRDDDDIRIAGSYFADKLGLLKKKEVVYEVETIYHGNCQDLYETSVHKTYNGAVQKFNELINQFKQEHFNKKPCYQEIEEEYAFIDYGHLTCENMTFNIYEKELND